MTTSPRPTGAAQDALPQESDPASLGSTPISKDFIAHIERGDDTVRVDATKGGDASALDIAIAYRQVIWGAEDDALTATEKLSRSVRQTISSMGLQMPSALNAARLIRKDELYKREKAKRTDPTYALTMYERGRAAEILLRDDIKNLPLALREEIIAHEVAGHASINSMFRRLATIHGLNEGVASFLGWAAIEAMRPAAERTTYEGLLRDRIRQARERGVENIRPEDLGLLHPVEAWIVYRIADNIGMEALYAAAYKGEKKALRSFDREAIKLMGLYRELFLEQTVRNPHPLIEAFQAIVYDHLYPHRIAPEKEKSALDGINMAVRTRLPELPGYHAIEAALWGGIHFLFEKAPYLQPDNREWARQSMTEAEGVKFDATRPAAETREERLSHLQFYERDLQAEGRRIVKVDSFSPLQFDENTVLVLVGNTADNPSQLSKYNRILDTEIFSHVPKGTRVIYLEEPLQYFTYAITETQKFNMDVERYVPERAKYIARHLFGEKVAQGGIQIDAAGRASGQRLPIAALKRNMRTNVIGVSWGGTLFAGVMNEVRNYMCDLGYTPDEIREAMKQNFCLMIAPSIEMKPQDSFSTVVSLLSENDLLVRSRIDTRPYFIMDRDLPYPRRLDIDQTQTLLLARIPRIVKVKGEAGDVTVWLRDKKGEPIYSKNGHEYSTYVRDLLVEFHGQHPEHALVNAIGAPSIDSRNELFDEPLISKVKPAALEVVGRVALSEREAVSEYVDDREAARFVKKTLEIGDRICAKIRGLGRYVPGEYEEISQEASRFLAYLDKHASHINFASILRTRAHDPRTRNRNFITMTNSAHPEGAESYTYAQAESQVNRVRRVFQSFGLGEGARIAIRGIAPEHFFAREAVLAEGGVASPLSTAYADDGLAERLQFINVDAIVTTAELLEQTMRVRDKVTRRFTKPFKIFVIERDEHGVRLELGARQKLLDTLIDGRHPDVYPLMTLAEKSPDMELPIRRVKKGQAALSMMTSGSSGVLKESLIPHSYGLGSYITSNVWWGVNGAATSRQYNSKLEYLARRGKAPDEVDRVFCTAPLGWMFPYRGLGIAAMTGAEFFFAKSSSDKQDDALSIRTLQEARISVLAGIPPLYRRFNRYLAKNGIKLPDLRHAISTAEVLGEKTIEDFYQATALPVFLDGVKVLEGVEIRNGYAATEEGPMFVHPQGMDLPRGALGVAVPGIDFELLDDEGKPVLLAPGNGGTLLVRKTPISSEYNFANPKDAAAYQGDIHTGLRGRYRNTHDAIVFQHDMVVDNITRTDDLIKRGVQIYPHEIQDKFTTSFPGNVINCTVGIKLSKDENAVVVEYLELPATIDQIGKDNLRRSIQTAVALIDRTKRPDFVIVGQAGSPRNQNKTQVRLFRKAMGSVVKGLRDAGVTRGLYAVPVLNQPIESMDVEQLGNLLLIDLSDTSA